VKDFVKIKQLEDVVAQMNGVFKVLEDRIAKLEAEEAKPARKTISKKETADG
jgi:hypothetical protein